MSNTTNILWRGTIAGFFIIVILGSLLHFVFEWTGRSKLIGSIAPVNESVWEHLKLGYWALIAFSIFEYRLVCKHVNNYFLAKCLGILSLELTILLIFYGYTAVLRKNILWIDISSYVAGVLVCQVLVYRVFQYKQVSSVVDKVCLFTFIGLGILFVVFTFYPPNSGLFMDHRTGTFGI